MFPCDPPPNHHHQQPSKSEKLTKREVEAKFCNFSLSTNSVSVCTQASLQNSEREREKKINHQSHLAAAELSTLAERQQPPCLLPPSIPVADAVQVHRTEGGVARGGAAADIAHQAEDGRHSVGQAGPQRPGGADVAAEQARSQTAGVLFSSPLLQTEGTVQCLFVAAL